MKDLVSVIIPSYNHKNYLSDLLNSINNQTYQNIETVIIDDGSEDGSQELLKLLQPKFKFKLVLKSNEGLCATINRGLDIIKGAYVIIIASDDYMPISRVEQQVKILSSTSYDAISGGMTIFSDNSRAIKFQKPPKIGEILFLDLLKENLIFAPTVMFKAETFDKFGKYNPKWAIEDYPMWLKILSENGRIAVFDFNWAFYRKNSLLASQKNDWYFNGLFESLLLFDSNPLVKKSINRYKFRYFIKLAFSGDKDLQDKIRNFSNKNSNYSLSGIEIIFISFIYILPKSFKNSLIKYFFRS